MRNICFKECPRILGIPQGDKVCCLDPISRQQHFGWIGTTCPFSGMKNPITGMTTEYGKTVEFINPERLVVKCETIYEPAEYEPLIIKPIKPNFRKTIKHLHRKIFSLEVKAKKTYRKIFKPRHYLATYQGQMAQVWSYKSERFIKHLNWLSQEFGLDRRVVDY